MSSRGIGASFPPPAFNTNASGRKTARHAKNAKMNVKKKNLLPVTKTHGDITIHSIVTDDQQMHRTETTRMAKRYGGILPSVDKRARKNYKKKKFTRQRVDKTTRKRTQLRHVLLPVSAGRPFLARSSFRRFSAVRPVVLRDRRSSVREFPSVSLY